MPRLVPFALVILLLVAGCEGDSSPSPSATMVSAEAVERYRTDALLQTQAIDSTIARIEARAVGADSATTARYQQTLNDLYTRRQAVQRQLDSLRVGTEAQFDARQQALDQALDALRRRVNGVAGDSARPATPTSASRPSPPAN